MKSLNDIANNQYGRKVLLYLLSPRDSHHFCPDIVRVLQEGDASLTRYNLFIHFGFIWLFQRFYATVY